MPRPDEDLVDALAGDVESAAELALARAYLVRCEHGPTEIPSGPVEALKGLVGDPKPTNDLPDLCLVAHLASVLRMSNLPLQGRRSRA